MTAPAASASSCPAPVAGIRVFRIRRKQGVHGRDKPGPDADLDSLNVTAVLSWGFALPCSGHIHSGADESPAERPLITAFYLMGLRFHTPTVNGQSTEERCGSTATR